METKNKNEEFASELRKLLLGFVSTTFAVLFALLINSWIAKKNEKVYYLTLLKGIDCELHSNQQVLENSFKPNYENAIIYRSLSTDFISNAIKDKNFINNSPDELLGSLIEFKLQIERINAFREADETYKYDTIKFNIWYNRLKMAWPGTIEKTEQFLCHAHCILDKEIERRKNFKTNF